MSKLGVKEDKRNSQFFDSMMDEKLMTQVSATNDVDDLNPLEELNEIDLNVTKNVQRCVSNFKSVDCSPNITKRKTGLSSKLDSSKKSVKNKTFDK